MGDMTIMNIKFMMKKQLIRKIWQIFQVFL